MNITENGTYEITTTPGLEYTFTVSGAFRGGSVMLNWRDEGVSVYPGAALTSPGMARVVAQSHKGSIVVSGASSPDLEVIVLRAVDATANDGPKVVEVVAEDAVVVTGSGTEFCNGTYIRNGNLNGLPMYVMPDSDIGVGNMTIESDGENWHLGDSDVQYFTEVTMEFLLNIDTWRASNGVAPVPVLTGAGRLQLAPSQASVGDIVREVGQRQTIVLTFADWTEGAEALIDDGEFFIIGVGGGSAEVAAEGGDSGETVATAVAAYLNEHRASIVTAVRDGEIVTLTFTKAGTKVTLIDDNATGLVTITPGRSGIEAGATYVVTDPLRLGSTEGYYRLTTLRASIRSDDSQVATANTNATIELPVTEFNLGFSIDNSQIRVPEDGEYRVNALFESHATTGVFALYVIINGSPDFVSTNIFTTNDPRVAASKIYRLRTGNTIGLGVGTAGIGGATFPVKDGTILQVEKLP